MKRVHAHLFSDTYEWAGQERTVPENNVMMSKQAPSVLSTGPRTLAYTYYRVRDIAPAAQAAYTALADEDHLKGLRRAKFVDRLARHWAQINHIHSFREGNTRSQFEFFRVLCADAGWSLDTGAYRQGSLRQAFVNGRYYFQATGDHRRLARALDVAVTTPHLDKDRSGIAVRFGLSSSQQLPHPDVMNRAHAAHQPTVLPPPSRGPGITR
ncbi:hypothetical protein FOS14_19400 [Skermania sp. ID1734]|uniref:Fic family protein n=1 Tax=Skermania sp. ID1734 TaxID=2597516 RepID=UPI0011803609|nr:Fic family protein [Skermania sp. ID1734]TSD94810.1 hypothetical protein FOS14_19400 [Skermania sp. ID1734]